MQPQNRRLILFMLFTFALMSGYTWVKLKYFTPQTLSREQLLAIEPALRLTAYAPTANGLADAVELGVRGVVDRANHFAFAKADLAARREEVAKAKPAAPPTPKPEGIVLGGPDYHLQVTLTPRGAGVDRLILTHFREADHYGLPEYLDKEKKQPKPLELIPPDDVPSFVLYHYADAKPEEERPLDTLGLRDWTVTANNPGQDEHTVAFSTDLADKGVRITKTYSLKKKEYHVGLTVKVERLPDAKQTEPFRYQLAGAHGLPIEGEWYTTIFRNTLVGWVTKDGSVDRFLEDSATLSRSAGSDRKSRLPDMTIQYAATAIQYFASAIVVDDQQPKRNFIEFVRGTVERTVDPQKPFLDDVTVRAISEPLDLKPGQSVEHKYLLYHGPVKVRLLEQLGGEAGVSAELAHRYEHTLHLNSLTDYGRWGFWTNAIVFFTNAIHALIGILRPIVRYDGICIILVTVLVRGLMFPLSRRQQATMARTQEQMAKVAPDVKKIKEKYKNDMIAQQQAMSELYRRHGINPAAGLGGCLMLFLQMPVFLGLYFALQESFFFRLERFLWIRNLTAPDMLIWWGEKIPWISDPASQGSPLYLGPYFNLLPVLAVTLMVIQQQMMTPPTADEQMQQTQKMMKWMMIIMGLMFYKMPSGLCIYFIATTLWGFFERKLSKKKLAADAAGGKPGTGDGQASPNGKTPGPRGRGKSRDKQPESQPSRFAEWWARVLKEASKK
ncbi:MAG TPA: membrane protein insertase YidC [Gemmataceae bacterium]|jgi:YidC/Oxa1 family membrane protein insertase|nr:membrane protein insertase YidC [Gemmataceae bacterium]